MNSGIWCSFVKELPAGGAEVSSISGSVGAVGGHDFNMKIVRLTGAMGASIHATERANHEREVGMKVQRRDFLLSVTLAAAAATPALGQTVAPSVGPAAAVRKAPHPSRISPAYGPIYPGPTSSRRCPAPAR